MDRPVMTRVAPLLSLLDSHRRVLREAIAAAASGRSLPAPDTSLALPQAGAQTQLFARLGALDDSIRARIGAAGAAGSVGDITAMWNELLLALDDSDRLSTELVDAALVELSVEVADRKHVLTDRLHDEFLDALSVGRFTLRVTDGLIVQADEAFAAFLGTQPEHVVGVPAGRFIPQEKLIEIVEQSMRSGRPGRAQVRTLGVDRAPVTLDIIAFMQQAADRDELQCMAVDVSQVDGEIVQRRLLSAAIEASHDAVIITDATFHVVYVNPAFVRVTGYDPDEVIGRHPRFLQGHDTSGPTLDRLRAALRAGQPVRAELVNYRKDGQPFWIDLSVVPVTGTDAAITHWVSVGRDVSERKKAEQEITRLAMEDYLTGLLNRRAAEARLQLEWNRARRAHAQFALALVDIDRFKLVNDQYGHEIGDRALRHVAQVINSTLRGGDWVARWGGEEFVICFHDLDASGALKAGERIRRQIKDHLLVLDSGELAITVSLGISVYRPAHDSISQILAEADALLYEAKQGGRDKVLCVGETDGLHGSVIWEGTQVQSALQDQRVVAAFQPVVDLRSGAQVGLKAFARIIARDERVIEAAQFIGAAEQLHLAAAIDQAIAARTLALARAGGSVPLAHPDSHAAVGEAAPANAPLTCFLNLSPQFLAKVESVQALIALTEGIDMRAGRRRFVIEITERQGGDLDSLKGNLRPLVDAGFHLALDDFGSGYSSFQYLADLPIRYLKIEGWMVARAVSDSRIRQLLETIVSTARKFQLITVAECVEEASTAQVLCDLGVDWAQGFFFGAPVIDRQASPRQSAMSNRPARPLRRARAA